MVKSGCDAVYAERHTRHTSRTATRKRVLHIVRIVMDTGMDTGGVKMAELKKCPFCGGRAKFVILDYVNQDTTQWHKVMCENVFECGAELGEALSGYSRYYEDQVRELKNRWNRRANDGK